MRKVGVARCGSFARVRQASSMLEWPCDPVRCKRLEGAEQGTNAMLPPRELPLPRLCVHTRPSHRVPTPGARTRAQRYTGRTARPDSRQEKARRFPIPAGAD
jgi:hypothetical protein